MRRVIALFHVVLQAQRVDGADVVQRFGHLAGDAGDRAAVFQLRRQHALLHMAREDRQQRQHEQQQQRKARCS